MITLARWLLLVALLLGTGAAHAQNAPEAAWLLGNVAYGQADYDAAVRHYREALAVREHWWLWLNISAAYEQQGARGLALAAALRAQQDAPRQHEAGQAVARLRAGRVDMQGAWAGRLEAAADLTAGQLSRGELLAVVYVLYASAFVVGLVVAQRASARDVAVPLLLVCMVALAFVGGLYLVRVAVDVQRPLAVVAAPSVMVFSGPGEEYMALYTLGEAAELRVVAQEGGWARVILPDAREGWLLTGSLALVHNPFV